MCRVLQVSRSGYYAARQRPTSRRRREDRVLSERIRTIHAVSRRRYGVPRIHRELREDGLRCGRKRVERLMRQEGLRAKKGRRFVVTTQGAGLEYRLPGNLLQRRFRIPAQDTAQRTWAADLTYLPTREGWLYLAAIIDLTTREIVGWATGERLDRSLAVRALKAALDRRRSERAVLHHSDQGVQYASAEYQALLAAHGIASSMSRKGDCWDNAVAESFFATLKWELVADANWATRHEARRAVFEYIEIWYNRQRRHSSLDYLSPAQYAEKLRLRGRAA
jgi:transposase InsO family protein